MSKRVNQKLSRKGFLGIAWGFSLVGLLGQAGMALLQFIKPRVKLGSFGGIVTAGVVDEFEPGTISHVQQGRFYISRLEDGGILALWHRCTHLGCTVPWREDEGKFHCPCHSSIFDVTGEVVSGPAPRPLDMFPIEISDGEILVDTGNPTQRETYDPSQVTQI